MSRYFNQLFAADNGGAGSQPPSSDPPPTTPPPADPPASPPSGQPGPVPYDRFKEVNDRLKQTEERLAEIERAEKDAKEKALAEQSRWQELAEQRETELKAEQRKRTRLEVATRKGIPPDLAGRLQGETIEEMEKDADSLLAFLKPASGPGVPPGSPRGQGKKPLDFSNMTPEEIREATKGKSVGDVIQ